MSGTVCAAAVVDVEDLYLPSAVVDPVADTVLTPSRPPQPLEGLAQGASDDAWTIQQRTGDELPRREGRRLRQMLAQGAASAGREDQPVGRPCAVSLHAARVVAA